MIHQRWEPEHGPTHDVGALLRGLPDLSGVTPWDGAFGSAPAEPVPESTAPDSTAPESTEPPAFVPLPEVEPLVAAAPVEPPPDPAPPAAATRLYVASSWDSLGGAAPETVLPPPYVEPAPVLEGKKATEVLAELGFLDD